MFRRFALLVLVLGLISTACTSDGAETLLPASTVASTTTEILITETTTTTLDDGFPVTVETSSGPVTIENRPARIVSISPTSTEVLFAIGAGEQVVAVDSLSNFPPEAPVTDIEAFTPNVEAIAALEPDLVFLSFDPGDVVASFDAIGIPTIIHAAAFSMQDAYAQWEQVGLATGHTAQAAALVVETEERLVSAFDAVQDESDQFSYYYELDVTYYSITSATFIGGLISQLGIHNIADEADPDGWGYPQLSAEFIVDSDPTLILLADTKCCGGSAASVGARPGWSAMSAVVGKRVVELDDDVASRWGPRVADLIDEIVAAVIALELVGS